MKAPSIWRALLRADRPAPVMLVSMCVLLSILVLYNPTLAIHIKAHQARHMTSGAFPLVFPNITVVLPNIRIYRHVCQPTPQSNRQISVNQDKGATSFESATGMDNYKRRQGLSNEQPHP